MRCQRCHKFICQCPPPIIVERDWKTQLDLVIAEKDQLEAKVAELQQKCDPIYHDTLKQQLAAAQATSAKLREALKRI